MPKNGYAYIYISNESDEPVYFDNFVVGMGRGRIIEEDHYYAYGLKIAAISSNKLPDLNEGNIDNKNLYNDKELFDDADLDWYDYGFRNYDAQIGRFTQLDPLTWDYPDLTNYQYASDEPIANVDMDGLEEANVTKVFKGATQAAADAANEADRLAGHFLNDIVVKTTVNPEAIAKLALKKLATQSLIINTTSKIVNNLETGNERKTTDNTRVMHTGDPNIHVNYGSQPMVWGNGTPSTSNGKKPDPRKRTFSVNSKIRKP